MRDLDFWYCTSFLAIAKSSSWPLLSSSFTAHKMKCLKQDKEDSNHLINGFRCNFICSWLGNTVLNLVILNLIYPPLWLLKYAAQKRFNQEKKLKNYQFLRLQHDHSLRWGLTYSNYQVIYWIVTFSDGESLRRLTGNNVSLDYRYAAQR